MLIFFMVRFCNQLVLWFCAPGRSSRKEGRSGFRVLPTPTPTWSAGVQCTRMVDSTSPDGFGHPSTSCSRMIPFDPQIAFYSWLVGADSPMRVR